MKAHGILTAAALLLSGGFALAQQQYDSLGSPTPAPNQSASPNAVTPNVPNTGGVANGEVGDKVGASAHGPRSTVTTGAGAVDGGVNGPVNTGTSTPTDPNSVSTPGGMPSR